MTAVTIADTATLIVSHDSSEADTQVCIQADSGNGATVYVAPSSGVTTSNGLELAAGSSLDDVRLVGGVNWYGIVASGTETIRVVEVNA